MSNHEALGKDPMEDYRKRNLTATLYRIERAKEDGRDEMADRAILSYLRTLGETEAADAYQDIVEQRHATPDPARSEIIDQVVRLGREWLDENPAALPVSEGPRGQLVINTERLALAGDRLRQQAAYVARRLREIYA